MNGLIQEPSNFRAIRGAENAALSRPRRRMGLGSAPRFPFAELRENYRMKRSPASTNGCIAVEQGVFVEKGKALFKLQIDGRDVTKGLRYCSWGTRFGGIRAVIGTR
jgi:hypothetical protein